ncbi:MAG: protein adenylyltransferase SelO family protein, partial [Rubrivivax sp.]
AVVTRVAPSFLRFGHFEHFAHHDQPARLAMLVDSTIAHHFPACADAPVPAAALLAEVARRTAELIAHWQAIGFCHGVMNTDNLSMLGLTIDYGPFGFLDGFDPNHICNHSDHEGRYAYARQPNVGFWNLHALAQALLPLIGDTDAALAAIEPYRETFPRALLGRLRAKLGLVAARDEDEALANDWLRVLGAAHTDFTIAFRRLSGFDSRPGADNDALRDLFVDRSAFDGWAVRYAARLRAEASVDAERRPRMDAVNPRIVLRNHLAEQAIRSAQTGDFGELQRLHQALQRPFADDAGSPADAGFPPAWAGGLEVSCSS